MTLSSQKTLTWICLGEFRRRLVKMELYVCIWFRTKEEILCFKSFRLWRRILLVLNLNYLRFLHWVQKLCRSYRRAICVDFINFYVNHWSSNFVFFIINFKWIRRRHRICIISASILLNPIRQSRINQVFVAFTIVESLLIYILGFRFILEQSFVILLNFFHNFEIFYTTAHFLQPLNLSSIFLQSLLTSFIFNNSTLRKKAMLCFLKVRLFCLVLCG